MRQTDTSVRKSRIKTYIFIYCVIMLLMAVISFYTAVYVISDKVKKQNEHLIQSYSDKTTALIYNHIEGMDNFLEYMKFCISNDVDYRQIQAVRSMYESLDLMDMWVMEGDEVYSYQQQGELTGGDQDLLREITAGSRDVMTKYTGGNFCTYAVRRAQNEKGEVLATIVLVDRLNILDEYISRDLQISDRLEQYLLDDAGYVYYSSVNLAEGHTEILDLLEDDHGSETLVSHMREVLEKALKNTFIYYSTDQEKLAYAEKIYDKDLYLLTIAPTSALLNQETNRGFVTLQVVLIGQIIFAGLSIAYFLLIRTQHFKEVRYVIYHDSITDDMNYLSFKQRAAEQIRTAKSALVLLDIKKFKIYNDIFGFVEGDELLKSIHHILKKHCKEQELLCRAYADHFCMLWLFEEKEEVQERLKMLLDDLEALYRQNQRFKMEFSVGISYGEGVDKRYPSMDVIDVLYSEAMIACQHRKKDSGNTCCEYDADLRRIYLQHKLLQDRLIKALEEKSFEVWYQPKYDLESASYSSCEALARPGAEISDISTETFIKFFEDNEWIDKFDFMVFEKVCQDIRRWLDGGRQVLPVSLNLSRENTYDFSFIDRCLKLMEKYQISHDLIQFEITETWQILENRHLTDLCRYLHEQGFAILLDDFGVGYSSISTLVDIPFDILKLDSTLIWKIGSPEGETILRSLILLAESLNKKVIAEGVETAEQEQFLREQGVRVMQGYRYQKAMAPDAYGELLRADGEML